MFKREGREPHTGLNEWLKANLNEIQVWSRRADEFTTQELVNNSRIKQSVP